MKDHPLFPEFTYDEDKGEILYIFVTRENRTTGKPEWSERINAGDLTNLDQIRARFGAGRYVVIGRNASVIVARSPEYNVEAAQTFPMQGPRNPEAPATAQPGLAAPPPIDIARMMPTPSDPSAAMMLGMFQFMAAQSAQNTQLVVAMMQAQAASAERSASEARAMYQQTLQQMTAVMSHAQQGPAVAQDAADKARVDWLEFGINMGKSIAGGTAAAAGVPGPNVKETIDAAVEGLKAVAGIAGAVRDMGGPAAAAKAAAAAAVVDTTGVAA